MKMKIYLLTAAAIISCLFTPAVNLSAQDQPAITLYGTDGCGYCQAMKRNLDAENIKYTFYDINRDKSKGTEMWKKVYSAFPGRKGSVTFPVMDIGGTILVSPKFDEVKTLLGSGGTKKETDDSSADKGNKDKIAIVIPDRDKDGKFQDLQDLKNGSVIFQNRYYKGNVWDAQRLPATPSAGKSWKLLGFKYPYETKTRSYLNWGKAGDRYLAFDIEEDEHSSPSSLDDDIFNSGKKYRIVLNLFESSGTKVKTVSEWGKVFGLGSAGFMYVQEDIYGTMFTNSVYKENNTVTYKPDLAAVTKLSEIAGYSYRKSVQKTGK